MEAVRKLGVTLGVPLRQERAAQGVPFVSAVRPCRANQLVASIPFSACLFHPSAPLLCRTGLTVSQAHRRPFLLAPNTFAAACTLAHRRPRSLQVPPLEPADPVAPLPKPRDDTDLDTALALIFASVRFRIGMGLPLPADMRALASYLSLVDYSAGCTLGMLDSEIALDAAMWQHAHNGLSEEALTEMVANYLFEADTGNASESDEPSARLVADACRRLFPLRDFADDSQAADAVRDASKHQVQPSPTGHEESPPANAALDKDEQHAYIAEVLSTSIGSALHDARRTLLFIPFDGITAPRHHQERRVANRGRGATAHRLPCLQAFVPFAALMTHSSRPSCRLEVSLERKAVDVVTTRPVPPGGELTLRYRTNAATRLEHEVEMITRYNTCA
uniref:SET domain-containing protein n=1 Tax=Neobodo designis TaxID=312471 RepID=A0A7S1M0A3_NEODS|mmetsp:Transcript_31676/g.97938  ORF Transcript_31676/g.97938 Transcript_31676/m.97938 type:complete len:391 (+) Transcript_31676:43-1215(+)